MVIKQKFKKILIRIGGKNIRLATSTSPTLTNMRCKSIAGLLCFDLNSTEWEKKLTQWERLTKMAMYCSSISWLETTVKFSFNIYS